MDRPEDYAIQQLLDELAEVEGLGVDDRALLLRLANTVVTEHDRWLHAACRYLRERDKARERVMLMGHTKQCSRTNSSACDCGYSESLHDEQKQISQIPDGTPHIRDDDCRCVFYEPGKPDGSQCLGDGHYLCKECKLLVPSEPAETFSDTNGVIILDTASAEKLERILEESPGPNEELHKLMASKPPWEKPE
jgi:hypothetical protein